jgi:hypothetical protein
MQWIGTMGTPLFSPLEHTWLQLEHPWPRHGLLPVLASGVPVVTSVRIVTSGFRHWCTTGTPLACTTGTPLEYPWKRHWAGIRPFSGG